eukprot:gene17084-26209_t
MQRNHAMLQVRTRVSLAVPPPVMLAHSYKPGMDVGGWYWSEKLDGIRAYWNGSNLFTRNGNSIQVPKGFKTEIRRHFGSSKVDGELFAKNNCFQQTMSAVMRQTDPNPAWKLPCGTSVRFVVFDLHKLKMPFKERAKALATIAKQLRKAPAEARKFVTVHKYSRLPKLGAAEFIDTELAKVLAEEGEGLMIRNDTSEYVEGRSDQLLKVKSFEDSEALVTDWAEGTGRFLGLMGALRCRLHNGITFEVGSGLPDWKRFDFNDFRGKVITIKHQGFTNLGVPRFPTFVGLRLDRCPSEFEALADIINKVDLPMGLISAKQLRASR